MKLYKMCRVFFFDFLNFTLNSMILHSVIMAELQKLMCSYLSHHYNATIKKKVVQYCILQTKARVFWSSTLTKFISHHWFHVPSPETAIKEFEHESLRFNVSARVTFLGITLWMYLLKNVLIKLDFNKYEYIIQRFICCTKMGYPLNVRYFCWRNLSRHLWVIFMIL